jgi:hypothetical protein
MNYSKKGRRKAMRKGIDKSGRNTKEQIYWSDVIRKINF